ncbi:hypothetical protein EJ110_NYTH04344 [Nymphaea thermarum]|nr:hypothetical protein EJ110_NYTH04344 [Nymphaea thermarum]
MHDFSTVDGFMDVNDCVVEMIQRVANEPSVGLFYVQQHTQNAVPNLIRTKASQYSSFSSFGFFLWRNLMMRVQVSFRNVNNTIGQVNYVIVCINSCLQNRVMEKSNEVALHTANLDDSITMVRSMKDFGVPIADQMTKDIQKSLIMLSSMKLQKRPFRLTSEGDGSSSWRGLRMARSGSWGGSTFGSSSGSTQVKETGDLYHQYEPSTSEPSQMTESKGSNKLSAMLNSAKQKASVLRWLQRDASGPHSLNNKFSGSSRETPPLIDDIRADDPHLSGQISHQSEMVEHYEPSTTGDPSVESYINEPSELMESFEKFKSDREAKLEEWLKETSNHRYQIDTNENTATAD